MLRDWVAAVWARLRQPWADRHAFDALEFVIVDVETTGWSPEEAGITEIGAVRMSGGQIRAEFSTLVNPGRAIPPDIEVLTGISDDMVASAPPAGQALASFLAFAQGAVLTAHNAPFDVSFLAAAQLRPARARRAPAGRRCSRHRGAGPPIAGHRRAGRGRRAQLQAEHAGGLLRRAARPAAPGAGRRPGHRHRAGWPAGNVLRAPGTHRHRAAGRAGVRSALGRSASFRGGIR